MRNVRRHIWLGLVVCGAVALSVAGQVEAESPTWTVDNTEHWKAAKAEAENLSFAQGKAKPTSERARFASVAKTFGQARRAKRITFQQDGVWNNWRPTKVGSPKGTRNAPVLLSAGKDDYWYFAEKKGAGRGYHAWHSTDMKAWTHKGQVTESRWVTSAEYADEKFYIYYDKPNDEDPHLVIDKDLTDGKNRDVGEVFADPSHGSDSGVLRAGDGSFHLIYENWSAKNVRSTRSADSPIAGHAQSPDGIHGFEPRELPDPIDERGGKGPQDVFGDYTLAKVGARYYIFCDYHPHDGPIRIGHWFSKALDQRFQWGGGIGKGFHPDPSIGFAEGRFYLIVQRHRNFVSRGPWAQRVEARAGVDKDADGSVDRWTDWQQVKETYSRKPGFARIVQRKPAQLDLSALPAGRGFRFEFRTEDTTDNKSKPVLDRVTLEFQ